MLHIVLFKLLLAYHVEIKHISLLPCGVLPVDLWCLQNTLIWMIWISALGKLFNLPSALRQYMFVSHGRNCRILTVQIMNI